MTDGLGRAGRYTVLFDGDCPLCRRSVEALKARDLEGVLDFIPNQDPRVEEVFPGQDPGVEGAFPVISREELATSIHLVGPGGEIWEGAGAVEELARILPRLRWLEPIFRLPFARPLARGVYRLVARNRPSS